MSSRKYTSVFLSVDITVFVHGYPYFYTEVHNISAADVLFADNSNVIINISVIMEYWIFSANNFTDN